MKKSFAGVLFRWRQLGLILALSSTSTTVRCDVDQAAEWGKYLRQHGYGVMRVDIGENNNEVVTAQVNGQDTKFIIDTGCNRTNLTAQWARHLKLTVQETSLTSLGVGGGVRGTFGIAPLNSFKLNNYEINRTNTIVIMPESAHIWQGAKGLLGFDYLRLNAAILPVGARIFFYKPGNAPAAPIDRYMNALGYKPIPLQFARGGLRIKGDLNGQPLTALVDSGDEYSTFDFDYARKIAGASVFSAPMMGEGVDGQRERTYVFTPNRLDLGPLSIKPFEMTATPITTFAQQGFNALLGYDFLAMHQAIIDLGHNTLWMK